MLPDNFFSAETVVTGFEVQSKKRLLEQIAELFAATNQNLEAHHIFDKLIERERLGSTGLGKGIALPHARIDGLEQARAVFVRLAQPVEFEALDNQPVDLVVALLVPTDANNEHLKILAGLAGFFVDSDNCAELRKTTDKQRVVELLTNSLESSLTAAS